VCTWFSGPMIFGHTTSTSPQSTGSPHIFLLSHACSQNPLTKSLCILNLCVFCFDVYPSPLKTQHTPVILHDMACRILARIHDQNKRNSLKRFVNKSARIVPVRQYSTLKCASASRILTASSFNSKRWSGAAGILDSPIHHRR